MKFFKFSKYFCIIIIILVVGLVLYLNFNNNFEPKNCFVSGTYYCSEYVPYTQAIDPSKEEYYKNEATKYTLNVYEINQEEYNNSDSNCVLDYVSNKYYKVELVYSNHDKSIIDMKKLKSYKDKARVTYSPLGDNISVSPCNPGSNQINILYNDFLLTFILNNN